MRELAENLILSQARDPSVYVDNYTDAVYGVNPNYNESMIIFLLNTGSMEGGMKGYLIRKLNKESYHLQALDVKLPVFLDGRTGAQWPGQIKCQWKKEKNLNALSLKRATQ